MSERSERSGISRESRPVGLGPSQAKPMKLLGSLLVGAVALGGGCAGRVPEPKAPTMVRSFHGTLVPGYYVSPSAYEHYIRAQLLSNDGRAEEAADQLRQAIASDGASAYLRTRLAEELLTLGRIDEAREEIEASLHLDGQFAEAYVDMARVKLRLGDAGGAEGALKRAVDVDRTCEDAYVLLVNLYRERGQDGRAQETWRAAGAHVPTSAPAHHALARIGAGARRLEDGRGRARPGARPRRQPRRRARGARPALPGARAASTTRWRRSPTRTIAPVTARRPSGWCACRWRPAAPSMPGALVERLEDEGGGLDRKLWVGWRWLDAAKAGSRARHRRRGAQGVRTRRAAHLLMGRALEALGQPDEAIAQLGKVSPRAAQYVAAQSLIGRMLRDRGRYREAAETIGRAIASVAKASRRARPMRCRTRWRRCTSAPAITPQAVKLLEQALARRPQSPELAFALGAAYQRNGQWERAVDVVRASS